MNEPDLRQASCVASRGRFLALVILLGFALVLVAMGATASPARVTAQEESVDPLGFPPALQNSQKSASQRSLAPGERLTYTIWLRNTGPASVTVDVIDPVPPTVQYVDGSASHGAAYDNSTATLTWKGITVPRWGVVPLTFAVAVDEVLSPTLITNTAIITAGSAAVERSTWTLLVPQQAGPGHDLRNSQKTASRTIVASGERLTYTIWLRNTGPAAGVAQVADPLPTGVQYVPGSASPDAAYSADTRTLSWANVAVPGWGAAQLTFAVTAKEVLTPTLITNTAIISAGGVSLERSTWTLLVPERPGPGHDLWNSRKTASRRILEAGGILTYTIWVRNAGPEEVIAQVTDPLPAAVEYVEGSASHEGTYKQDSATLSWDNIPIPGQGAAQLTFAVRANNVLSPTLVTNTATISVGGESIERSVLVLLVPQRPRPEPRLGGSHKTASQHMAAPGQTVTYTILLHSSGVEEVTARVTDSLPAEMQYVHDSASPKASYNKTAGTLTWDCITVPVRGETSLTFAMTAGEVESPRMTVNRAEISAGDRTWEKQARVLLLPAPPTSDVEPPVVHSLTIEDRDVLADPKVTLHISATDNVGVASMYLREWQWTGNPWPHWEVVQSSGWIPFEADYAWELSTKSGAHFVGLWVADAARNRSSMGMRAIDFASLILPGAEVPPIGIVPYLVYYDAGEEVSASLTSTSGEARLYAWALDRGRELIAGNTEEISFTTEAAGIYLFVVDGEHGDTYDLTIAPAGGPRADRPAGPAPRGPAALTVDRSAGVAADLLALFSLSDLDPLDSAQAPIASFQVYLPFVAR
jgi:uncharacterized repeat protein (TIGR01451 family)